MLPFSSEVRILRKHSPMFVSTRNSVTLSRTISFSGSFVPKRYFILLTTLPFFIRCIDKELSIPLISRISNRRDLRTVYTIRSLSFKNRTGNIPLAFFANNEIFHCTTCFHFAIIKLINIERDRRSFRMTHFNPLNLNFTIKAARLEYYKRAFSSEGTKINGLFFPFSSNLDILISRCIPITHFDNKFTFFRRFNHGSNFVFLTRNGRNTICHEILIPTTGILTDEYTVYNIRLIAHYIIWKFCHRRKVNNLVYHIKLLIGINLYLFIFNQRI